VTRSRALLAAFAGTLVLSGAAAASPGDVQIAPVTRLPFPERGYVISVPEATSLDAAGVVVRENGLRVTGLRVDPLGSSGLRFGVLLALDASNSMAGAPAAAALEAARAFVSRRDDKQEIGVVTFNREVSVLRGLTQDENTLLSALATQPPLAYGTRIYDALTSSLALLRQGRISSGSIVLLSDGADIGSVDSLEKAIAAAKGQRVRIFSVGLRSGAFDGGPLRAMAARTGGSYAEARSAGELAAIYDKLGEQLAGEYLVRYRSAARPMSQVDVRIEVAETGSATTAYVAPTPSRLAPYHRSPLSRFLLSSGSPLVISLFFAVLVCSLLLLFARRPKTTMVDRVQRFGSGGRPIADRSAVNALRSARNRYAGGWWAQLERDLEIARMTVTPRQVVGMSLGGMALIVFIGLLLSSPLLALLGLAVPLVAKAVVRRQLKAVRDEFAVQFPSNLQVLASALRAGHSFNGALEVVVDNAHEPARSEMARIVRDDRLGVLPEDAIRRLARRMANRDVEQVALLAELQRTSGGNSAEVLDTVVATIRERAEIRGLVRTLTAQGRMARWILTGLPIFLTIFLWLTQPEVMKEFFSSGIGQVMLTVAAVMVVAGSLIIQRIVEIDI
jgi:tight adherence protein B